MELNSPSKRHRIDTTADQSLPAPSHLGSLGFGLLRPVTPDAVVHTKTFRPNGLIFLWSDQVYTVGRDKRLCDITCGDAFRISRRHCQFFLDGFRRRLLVSDGFFSTGFCELDDITAVFSQETVDRVAGRCSLNGVFVNGRRIGKGAICELFSGDEVSLACGNRCDRFSGTKYGFVVERIAFLSADQMLDGIAGGSLSNLNHKRSRCEQKLRRATALLSVSRSISISADPISCIHRNLDIKGWTKSSLNRMDISLDATVAFGDENIVCQPKLHCGHHLPEHESTLGNADNETANGVCNDIQGEDVLGTVKSDLGSGRVSDGKSFFLNRLNFMKSDSSECHRTVSLQELFHPIETLEGVFVATFTLDVSWFLSCIQLPKHLPITIACHNSGRCWSADTDSRTSRPIPDYPNLVIVYPPFPEAIAFGKDRKNKGVGCHHPKLLVMQRADAIRVVVTSANLVSRQWNNITNTVWWQDFPARDVADYSSLFSLHSDEEKLQSSRYDFSAQLAGFMSCLIVDVPSEAHWVIALTKYNFQSATCFLVSSVPGIHLHTFHSEPKHVMSMTETSFSDLSENVLASCQASIAGVSYRFRTSSDCSGEELKRLASIANSCRKNAAGLSEVLLKRTTNISADANAVSIVVSDLNDFCEGGQVQLGFLPREVAKWVAPLSDLGLFGFSGFVFPNEVLAAALEGTSTKVQLMLYISRGPKFSNILELIQPEIFYPLCSLLAATKRSLGLWRLQEVLSPYRWPESLETDFLYGASSIGTSICAQYLASFAAATGKRSCQFSDSDESDPEWGRWTTSHELKRPSLKILFPTIERVKNGAHGVHSSRFLLAFSEKTWQKMRASAIFHDAIPYPRDRVGHPMHVKVGCRRFKSRIGSTSFGWVYCGSHNFSPAAWGQLLCPSGSSTSASALVAMMGPRLHICNYELGVLFVFPPCENHREEEESKPSMDDIVLPFVVPAPSYQHNDRPATMQAMRDVALVEKEGTTVLPGNEESLDEEISDEEEDVSDFVAEESEQEKIYAEMLWSQVDSAETGEVPLSGSQRAVSAADS